MGGKKNGKNGGGSSGIASFVLLESDYKKVKTAIDNATPLNSVAGKAFRVTLNCATLGNLLGAVSSGFGQFCGTKKKKKGKGSKGNKGNKGNKGGKKGGK